MDTTLYYAQVGGCFSGLAFPIGNEFFFTTADDPTLYQVTNLSMLMLTAEVAPAMAEHLIATVIEPRLGAQTGRAA